ncbi:MAG: S41 family peptidase [Bacteroidia bacterium]|nr:S41 family peptidase [Bacteroidia bacterium]
MSETTGELKENLRSFRPIVYALILATGLAMGMGINKESKDKFSQIFEIIDNDYVDSTNNDVLQQKTIEQLLAQLDPHSTYIPPALTEINERQIRGNYEGLGIEYIKYQDTPFVYSVTAGGPADKAGIAAGDRMIAINGKRLVDSLDVYAIREAIQGIADKEIQLDIYRRKTGKSLKIKIVKEQIVINSSAVFYMVNKTLGYIQIERFSGSTHEQFINALEQLKQQGMKDLILDLRNNGGGLLTEAVAIANEFLEKDELIAYTYGNKRQRHDYIADGNGVFKDGKLVLLVNHNTASASEILAGALQDNDRAVVMGNRSFGKGLVQESFRLGDGSLLRLTIARYYTPSGRSIQKPYLKDIEAYKNEIYSRDVFKDTLNPILDPKIKKEFFTKNGRFLTMGGGIRPDIFLRDTISDSTEIEMLIPGLFYSRIFDIYLLDHMHQVLDKAKAQYKDLLSFKSGFEVSEQYVLNFIKTASRISYLRNLKSSRKTNDIIAKHLKSAIAYRLFGAQGRSMILNEEEGLFSKSLEVLKKYNQILNIGNNKTRSFDY